MKKYLIMLAMVGVLTQRASGDEKLGNSTSGNIGQARFSLKESNGIFSLLETKKLQDNIGIYSYNYNLSLALENSKVGENKSTSEGSKIGIYAIEFLSAGIVSFSWGAISSSIANGTPVPDIIYPMIEIPGNTLFPTLAVCITGNLLGEKGSFWKAMLGAGIGAILGAMPILPTVFLPPLGAVIGYNL